MGPWHMPTHPDERDDGGKEEREAADRHAEAFSSASPACGNPSHCTASTEHFFGNAGFHVYRCAKCGFEEWL